MAMNQDTIVEEVRKHREARAAKFGFNIRAMVEDARERQVKSGHPIVDLTQQNKAGKPPKTTGKTFRKTGLTSSKR